MKKDKIKTFEKWEIFLKIWESLTNEKEILDFQSGFCLDFFNEYEKLIEELKGCIFFENTFEKYEELNKNEEKLINLLKCANCEGLRNLEYLKIKNISEQKKCKLENNCIFNKELFYLQIDFLFFNWILKLEGWWKEILSELKNKKINEDNIEIKRKCKFLLKDTYSSIDSLIANIVYINFNFFIDESFLSKSFHKKENKKIISAQRSFVFFLVILEEIIYKFNSYKLDDNFEKNKKESWDTEFKKNFLEHEIKDGNNKTISEYLEWKKEFINWWILKGYCDIDGETIADINAKIKKKNKKITLIRPWFFEVDSITIEKYKNIFTFLNSYYSDELINFWFENECVKINGGKVEKNHILELGQIISIEVSYDILRQTFMWNKKEIIYEFKDINKKVAVFLKEKYKNEELITKWMKNKEIKINNKDIEKNQNIKNWDVITFEKNVFREVRNKYEHNFFSEVPCFQENLEENIRISLLSLIKNIKLFLTLKDMFKIIWN